MGADAFSTTLAGFRSWAVTTDRELSGEAGDVGDDLAAAFKLMREELHVTAPSQLTGADLRVLLLEAYPRSVVLDDQKRIDAAVSALRDMTTYLADAGAVTEAAAGDLRQALDDAGPLFPGALADPANWSPATAMMRQMRSDGVDLGNSAAVRAWLRQYNRSVTVTGSPAGADEPDDEDLDWEPGDLDDEDYDFDDDFWEPGTWDDDDDSFDWDEIDLKDVFELPDAAPPVRLPDVAGLAELARKAPLLVELRALARDVRDKDVSPGSADPALLALAEYCDLVDDAEEDVLAPGEDASWLDDLSDDDDAVEAWEFLFGAVVDETLFAADDLDPDIGEDLDLAAHGPAMAVALFFGGGDGVPLTVLSEGVREAATEELSGREAQRQWAEWTAAHGDPAQLLLGQLAKLSAASLTGTTARLEPLGKYAVGSKLVSCGVDVPLLPPAADMTAADLLTLWMLGSRDDFDADFAVWSAARPPADAARELLTCAADAPAVIRLATADILPRLPEGTEPALREALAAPGMRYYAKTALLEQLRGRGAGQPVPAELERTAEDIAWHFTDGLAPLAMVIEPDETFPIDRAKVAEMGWDQSLEEIFDVMARIGHPDAEAALTMLGRHCTDKKAAKAARKAAFRVKSGQARPAPAT